jgi:hypothetical protein
MDFFDEKVIPFYRASLVPSGIEEPNPMLFREAGRTGPPLADRAQA